MRWYEGGIADAISLSRQNGSIFVVYIEGSDDKSNKLTKIINSREVTQELEGKHFVAIKIAANSVPHQQFSEIYKQTNIPSVYFIGKSGTPLEIIVDVNDDSEFIEKINIVLLKNGTPKSKSPGSQVKPTSDFITIEKKNRDENGVCISQPNDEASASSLPSPNIEIKPEEPVVTPEQKLERAQELIEKKRETKRLEEEEKEKNREMERRKMGQDVQKLQRWQKDQELKNLMDERDKEKKEEQAARQRILAQIEQDKADRAAKFSSGSQSPPVTPTVNSAPAPRPVNSNVTRLQFRLPDGSTHTHEFLSEATLLEVIDYVRSNVTLTFSNFVLATTFPKHEFTDMEVSQTLYELKLVPSAVLLVLPLAHAPLLNMFAFLKSMVFGVAKPSQPSGSHDNKRSAETSGETSRQSAKKRAGETSVIRRHGNVHRLSDKTDSDDDNNTWNGNSTQQM